MYILHKCLPTTFVHIPEILLADYGFPVSAVVVNYADIPGIGEILHKRNIAFFVFAHSMYNLHDALWGARRFADEHCKSEIVVRRTDSVVCRHIVSISF